MNLGEGAQFSPSYIFFFLFPEFPSVHSCKWKGTLLEEKGIEI